MTNACYKNAITLCHFSGVELIIMYALVRGVKVVDGHVYNICMYLHRSLLVTYK